MVNNFVYQWVLRSNATGARVKVGPTSNAGPHRWRASVRLFLSILVLGAALSTLASVSKSASATASTLPTWQVTWTSPMDLADGVTSNSTTRDVATVAVAGTSFVLTFSNEWSATATTFAAVTVGVQASGVDVVPGTIVPVTFHHGTRSVTMAPYSQVTSDPVAMAVHAGESISVSMAVAGLAAVSVHYCCYGRPDSYATSNGVGNLTTSPTGAGFDPFLPNTNMRWLTAVSVAGSPALGAVVAFGDSITDGFGDSNNGFSWVNALQARIAKLPPTEQLSVVNDGIAGNTLTAFPRPSDTYEQVSGGVPGVSRLPQALALPGVKDVVLFLGTNDIWFGAGGRTGHSLAPYGTAAAIESGMRQVIAETHAHGVKIFGVTLLPRMTPGVNDPDKHELWLTSEQSVLSNVNAWMLSPNSGFDAVINLGAVMGDVYGGACQPTLPYAPYFNFDDLHPNIAGQTVMANAISTTLFGVGQAPQVPPLVPAALTPGCPGARVAAQVLAAGRQTSPPTTTSTSTTTTTTTATTTTPVTPPSSSRSGWWRIATYLALALLLLVLVALGTARRRAQRRRAARRRAARPSNYGGSPRPQRRR
ncbi:MAG: GDSL-type esterase/lipase family protein [Acidimicrobiales bacterium]